jgi:hypothetical protein
MRPKQVLQSKVERTPPAPEVEAIVTSIPVIELDRPESPIVRAEAEVETREEPALDAEAGVVGATRPINAQAGSISETAGLCSRPFDGPGANIARSSSRPFVSLGADIAGPNSKPFVSLEADIDGPSILPTISEGIQPGIFRPKR